LTHQGRVLKLANAALVGYAWQFYASNSGNTPPQPVTFTNCTINELGAAANARFIVDESTLQWALLAAVGPNSSIQVNRSTINSQTIMTRKNGIIRIDSSSIHGALVHALEDSRIILLNSPLLTNVCHSRCLPLCPKEAEGGCNPFALPGQKVRLLAEGNASIWALHIDPISRTITRGEPLTFSGDLLVESAGSAAGPYSWNLSYRRAGDASHTPIVNGAEGSVRGGTLGTLDTGKLSAGDYVAALQLLISGAPAAAVERPFSITDR
jgi:hypothetical protein